MSVDPNVLSRLQQAAGDADPTIVNELVADFVATSPVRMSEVLALAEAGDHAALARKAHALAGSAGLVGAQELCALCREIEVAAREGGDVANLASRGAATVERACDALRQWMATHSGEAQTGRAP